MPLQRRTEAINWKYSWCQYSNGCYVPCFASRFFYCTPCDWKLPPSKSSIFFGSDCRSKGELECSSSNEVTHASTIAHCILQNQHGAASCTTCAMHHCPNKCYCYLHVSCERQPRVFIRALILNSLASCVSCKRPWIARKLVDVSDEAFFQTFCWRGKLYTPCLGRCHTARSL